MRSPDSALAESGDVFAQDRDQPLAVHASPLRMFQPGFDDRPGRPARKACMFRPS